MEVIHLLKEIRKIRKNMELSRDEILEIQQEKLYKLIEHVLKNSKFYREYYGKHGITLENYREIEYTSYPTIDKSIVTEHFDELICTDDLKLRDLEEFVSQRKNWGKKYKKKYTVMTSSGSTGTPAIFVYDEKAWAVVKAFIPGRVDVLHGRNLLKKERMAFLIAAGGDFASYNLAMDAERVNYTTLVLNVNENFNKLIKAVKDFDPTILSGYSSSIARLAEEQLKGNLGISPKRVFCSADKLTPERRRVIERAFKVSPLDFYGASEALGMASEVPKRNKLFLFEDYYKLEIVDEDLNEVSQGETGSLIITSLYNYTMPLLRYRMEDRLKKSKEQDFNFTLVDEIVGRTLEDLSFEGSGGYLEKVEGLQLVGMYFEGIKKVQFIQKDKNTLKIRYVPRESIDPNKVIIPKMFELFRDKGLENYVEIETEKVEDILVDPVTGKYRQIIPYREGR